MTNITQWKKEAKEEFKSKWPFKDMTSYYDDFLDTLIDRIHAHTLEEVRENIELLRESTPDNLKQMTGDIGYHFALNTLGSSIYAALELLEHPTD